jgi:HEAT repeat protein
MVRVTAIETLVQIRRQPPVTVPALVAALQDPVPAVRYAAVTALLNLKWEMEQTLPPLLGRLKDPDLQVKSRTAIGLTQLDAKKYPDALAAAQPVLLEAVKSSVPQTRSDAASALPRVSVDKPDLAVEALVPLLSDAESPVRAAAIASLGQLGPAAASTLPVVTGFLADPVPNVATRVPRAVMQIDPEGGLKVILAALKNRDVHVRAAVAEGLGDAGRNSPEAVEALSSLLKDGQLEVRYRALISLSRVGKAAEPAMPNLIHVLGQDRVYLLRATAAEVLGQLGPAAASATPELVQALNDWNPDVRKRAQAALQKIAPVPAPPATPAK